MDPASPFRFGGSGPYLSVKLVIISALPWTRLFNFELWGNTKPKSEGRVWLCEDICSFSPCILLACRQIIDRYRAGSKRNFVIRTIVTTFEMWMGK